MKRDGWKVALATVAVMMCVAVLAMGVLVADVRTHRSLVGEAVRPAASAYTYAAENWLPAPARTLFGVWQLETKGFAWLWRWCAAMGETA